MMDPAEICKLMPIDTKILSANFNQILIYSKIKDTISMYEMHHKMVHFYRRTTKSSLIRGVGVCGKDLISPFSFVFTYVLDLSFLVSKSGQ